MTTKSPLSITAVAVMLLAALGGVVFLYVQAREPQGREDAPAALAGTTFVGVQTDARHMLMVAETEVTVADWRACEQDRRCPELSGNAEAEHPMVGVSWLDAQRYVDWYVERTGLPVRMPNAMEWIGFAANHAPKPIKPLFTDPRMAWAANYDLSARPMSRVTVPATSFGENAFGLFDIRGNVWEWTADCAFPMPGQDDCLGGRIAQGAHLARLAEFQRVPGNAGCGGGLPPANVGLRLVYTVSDSEI